jgi:hypothetical protein
VLTNVSDGLCWDRGGRWWDLRDTVGCNLCIDPNWLLFCHFESWNGFMWVVHVVGGISKSVDLKLIQQVLGNLIKKPVDDHAALDSTLRVDNKNDFVVLGVLERCFDFDIRVSDIHCGVAETSLYQTLYDVEYNTCCWVVDAQDRPTKSSREPVNVRLEPMLSNANAIAVLVVSLYRSRIE